MVLAVVFAYQNTCSCPLKHHQPHLLAVGIAWQLPSGWPLITPAQHLTRAMGYALVTGSSYQIWQPQVISKQFNLRLTQAHPCITFDPSNALHFDQGFFPPYQIWQLLNISGHFNLWLTPVGPSMTFDPSNAFIFLLGVPPAKFGSLWLFLRQLELWVTFDLC